MKKFFLLFVSLGLVLGILSACGGKEKATTGGSVEGDKKSEEQVTIKLHTHGTESGYAWKKTIEAFEKEYENIKVDVVQLSEKQDSREALQKIDLAAASGEQMDVIMLTNYVVDYPARVNMGMLEPLDKFIEEEGINMEEEYKLDLKIEDSYYGLPGKLNTWYVLLNKDHLDAAGLEVPKSWTWDEFMEYAKALTTEDRYGTYFHGPQGGSWQQYITLKQITQDGVADYLKADGTSNLDDPLFKESLAMRIKMEKEDKSVVPYSSVISQKMNYRDQFFTQATSMVVTGSWMNAELGGSDRFPVDFNIAVAPMPQNTKNENVAYTENTGDVVAIAANSEHKEAAWKFIRWFSTDGQIAQGLNTPAWAKVSDEELSTLVENVINNSASPEKVDIDSLLHTIKVSASAKKGKPVPYSNEITQAIIVEFEKLILDKQDLDTTVENTQKAVQELIDKNK
ncbi:sugar ABC transporter substrate-binding protein [Bacillus sp. FJAT-50079]|uniref:ABC transporter substrate-binding protein n=1 Tax=Bacillus sp. FJAT-50079 TaxID=2833577 RepID=UPI001BC9A323|nr:sugar ABC transporter substrate-binding protein [Bacillus sp. FJAT-50079]MBS4210167.1 sugar ABC transporter substrate-binding protein [Bacillus sp. FJAT-50079]